MPGIRNHSVNVGNYYCYYCSWNTHAEKALRDHLNYSCILEPGKRKVSLAFLSRLAKPEQDQANGVSSWATEESGEGLLGIS